MAAVGNNEDRLQQYFDGELSAEQAEAVRLELEASDDLRAKLRGLEHLRTMVREQAAAEPEIDGDALWAAIQGKIDEQIVDDEPMFPLPVKPEEPARPGLQVIPGGKKGEEKPAETKRRPRSLVWLGVAGTITAAAAAVLLFVLPQVNPPEGPPPGSEVEEVDFGYSTGAIFSVEGQEGERYAVVWISDEKPLIEGEEDEGTQ